VRLRFIESYQYNNDCSRDCCTHPERCYRYRYTRLHGALCLGRRVASDDGNVAPPLGQGGGSDEHGAGALSVRGGAPSAAGGAAVLHAPMVRHVHPSRDPGKRWHDDHGGPHAAGPRRTHASDAGARVQPGVHGGDALEGIRARIRDRRGNVPSQRLEHPRAPHESTHPPSLFGV
jgi:hypothetical protein